MKKTLIILILSMSVLAVGCSDNNANERLGSKAIIEIVYDFSIKETTNSLVYITASQFLIKVIDEKLINYDVAKG